MPVYTNPPIDVVEDSGTGNEVRSDYRPNPRTDRGNADYVDRGGLGFYQTNDGKPWAPPSDVTYMTGFGANMDDLKRGWKVPVITQNPAYQLHNYKDRSSDPKVSDVTPGNVEMTEAEWEFRNRNRRSQGFLTRPRIPTERG